MIKRWTPLFQEALAYTTEILPLQLYQKLYQNYLVELQHTPTKGEFLLAYLAHSHNDTN